MRRSPDLGHRLKEPEEVRLRRDDPGDRPVRIGQHPLEGGQVRGAGGVTLGDEWDLIELETAAEIRLGRLPVVRMDAARDEDAFALRGAAGHQGGFGGGRRAVVMRGRDDVKVDQLGQERLVFVDALERPLADLGLIGRVGRVPLAAEEQLVDGGRTPVAVHARAKEGRQVRPIARGETGQPGRELELGFRVGQVEGRCAKRGWDVFEQLVDRGEAECSEHVRPVTRRMRTVWHRSVSPPR